MEYSHRAVFLERLHQLRHGGALLSDRDIDAVELLRFIGPGVDRLLVDDGVDDHRGLAGLAVADDQLALAAADRDQCVDRLQAGLHRLVHRLARDDAGRLHLDAAALGGCDRALAVDRVAQPVDHAAEQRVAHRHVHDGRRCARRCRLHGSACRRRRSPRRRCRFPGSAPCRAGRRRGTRPSRRPCSSAGRTPGRCRRRRTAPGRSRQHWPRCRTRRSASSGSPRSRLGGSPYQAAPFMAYCSRCRRDLSEVS